MTDAARLLEPFDFRADFSPREASAGEVRLTPEEVIALIGKVRADTIAEAERRQSEDTLERLESAAADLRSALGQVVELMSLIEAAGYDMPVEDRMAGALRMAAARLIDGQGELFTASGDLSAKLDKPPSAGPGRDG